MGPPDSLSVSGKAPLKRRNLRTPHPVSRTHLASYPWLSLKPPATRRSSAKTPNFLLEPPSIVNCFKVVKVQLRTLPGNIFNLNTSGSVLIAPVRAHTDRKHPGRHALISGRKDDRAPKTSEARRRGGEEGVRWAGIGEEGIRTPDTVSGIPDFESGAFSHSATSPEGCLKLPPSNAQGRGLLAD